MDISWLQRLPDEEGIETGAKSLRTSRTDALQRLPDEEGIETNTMDISCVLSRLTGCNASLMKKGLRLRKGE